MAATTTLLGLVTPTQGTLSGTWGDTVNYGISDYVDIAIAGTLTFTGDGAITLANTTGSASGNGFNTTTAQYMVIRITGTQSIVKIITGPSYSKLYMVDHAGATSAVTFKAAGQTGVSIAVGEKAFVYYNGTDYVKVASSVADGVTTIDFGSTGLTPATATSGAVTVAGTLAIANGGTGTTSTTFANLATNVTGTLPIANGGTGTTSTTFANLTTNVTGTLPVANGGTGLTSFTSGGVVYASSTSALATGSALVFDGTNLGLGVTPDAWASGNKVLNIGGAYANYLIGSTSVSTIQLGTNGYYGSGGWTYKTTDYASFYQQYQGKHIWNNAPSGTAGNPITFTTAMTLDASGNLLVGGTAARGTTVGAAHLDLFNGTAPAGTLTNGVSLYSSSGDLKFMNAAGNAFDVGYRNIPQSGSAKTTSYTLAVGDVGEFIEVGASGSIVVPNSTFAAGDAVVIFNNTSGAITLTMSITTAYIGGTDADKATISLATRGICNVLFISGTVCVVTGNVT